LNPTNGTKAGAANLTIDAQGEDEVVYLSKRHRVSTAVVREIIRRIGVVERSAIEREIRKGMKRR